ncbi:MAG: endonuclease III [Deltaproteobacteria bacterium]|nr:endonuclease III [Deltaproteobacteria bacterium]
MARPSPKKLAHAREVLAALREQVPEPRCELVHRNAWELLVATILSARSTDRGVNKVTPVLFARYPTPRALAAAPQPAVEKLVHSTGFFRQKTKAIREVSSAIAQRHGGVVPRTMGELTKLRGVARKTANVVLGTAYGVASGVVVDVHVTRVAERLGLTRHQDPLKIEQDLMVLFDESEWIDLGHRLVLHGRYTCTARKPKCDLCACAPVCPSAFRFS